MDRIINQVFDDGRVTGCYDDPRCPCTWSWNPETKEIHDLTDTASVCVGYANNIAEVLQKK